MTEYIFIYTRAQAIADGVLKDISELAKEAGFKFPVAITQGAWAECVAVGPDDVAQDETGRLWDVLNCLRYAVRIAGSEQLIQFQVLVSKGGRPPRPIPLAAHCGPGDEGEGVVTITLPNEN